MEVIANIVEEVIQDLGIPCNVYRPSLRQNKIVIHNAICTESKYHDAVCLERVLIYKVDGTQLIDGDDIIIDLAHPYSVGFLKADIGLAYFVHKENPNAAGLVKLPFAIATFMWRCRKHIVFDAREEMKNKWRERISRRLSGS